MFIKEYTNNIEMPKEIFNKYQMEDMCYFDIETTGFDREEEKIILISMGYFKNQKEFYIKQYFAENLEEEKNILKEFSDDLINFNKWCSYNGIAFDEPFVIKRMDKSGIAFNVPNIHVDLYRIIRPYYKQLGMDRCNLKTAEKFAGIHRKDEIDGAKSVELYNEFLISRDEEIKHTLMLHNYEDVLDLPHIFKLVYRIDTDNDLERENLISKKQVNYIKHLLNKNNILINGNLSKVSKKCACKIITMILRNEIDEKYIKDVVGNSH